LIRDAGACHDWRRVGELAEPAAEMHAIRRRTDTNHASPVSRPHGSPGRRPRAYVRMTVSSGRRHEWRLERHGAAPLVVVVPVVLLALAAAVIVLAVVLSALLLLVATVAVVTAVAATAAILVGRRGRS
jgi:hypothetical protein